MRDSQDDPSRYSYSQQPTYPQPQQQQPYPPPTYYPAPPPPKPDTTIQSIVMILIIVFVVVPAILSVVLYFLLIGLPPSSDGSSVPVGDWGPVDTRSSTEVYIQFGLIAPNPRPMQLEIVLVRNATDEGRYTFSSNDDGQLSLVDGTNVGTLTYEDFTDNGRVNTGDEIRMTGLTPASDYTIKMIYGPTGDQIDFKDFPTPA